MLASFVNGLLLCFLTALVLFNHQGVAAATFADPDFTFLSAIIKYTFGLGYYSCNRPVFGPVFTAFIWPATPASSDSQNSNPPAP